MAEEIKPAPAFVGDNPIKFGDWVENIVTKDSGIVTAKFYQLSGCSTVGFRNPELRDANGRAIHFHTAVQMVQVQKDNEIFEHQPLEESNFRLGELVEAPKYGVKGIIIALAFYPDQSNHVEIQPPYNTREGKMPDPVSVPESYVVSCETSARPELQEAGKRPSPPSELSPRVPSSRDQ